LFSTTPEALFHYNGLHRTATLLLSQGDNVMKTQFAVLPVITLLAVALACNISPAASPTLSPAEIETLSAQTLIAMQWKTMMAQGTVLPQPGSTVTATVGPNDTATNTLLSSFTPTVLAPAATPTPTVTATAVPCNWVKFISDVTVPDNWETTPSDHFVKTWKLQNTGSCTWTSGYSLVFDHGDQMGAPASQQLTPGTVAPGGTIDVSVSLVSPDVAGTYQGYFKLHASDSSTFGIGADANTALWVKIVVKAILAPPVAAPTTQIISKVTSIPVGGTSSTTAPCPAGTAATGGGFNVNVGVHVYTQAMNGNGWAAVAKNNTASVQNLTVYAVCLTLPSVSTTMVHETLTVAAGVAGTKKADCPAGSVVTGGGFTGKPDGSLWTFRSAQSGNGWEAAAKNFALTDANFDVYAICLSGASVTTVAPIGYKDLAPGATELAEIGCAAGQVITGGGWNLDIDLTVFAALMSGGKWRVYARNNGTHTRSLQARGTCLGVA
jgi:hypothetical protein